ncbi:protein phosphatase 2C 32 isoform X1 [Elaeis guineensis]|uniref:protein-serine/threonine phosphatase n=1 Tax=Elaeis guineensis var. tenera TaxID=51953 RepID=A0A6I9QJJ3_ELAGV|nr:protein phosphatase 2C 32 isoform X2 [Elaeis guineensis]
MGNSTSRVVGCFVPLGNGKEGVNLEFLEPLDEGLGHSFCYVRPMIVDSPAITPSNSERYTVDSCILDSETHSGSFRQEIVEDLAAGVQRVNKNFSETFFKTISGASVSANASTARTGNPKMLLSGDAQEPAASFESTASFAAIPLQPVPRGSGPLNGFMSGPLERGFASGPLERGAGFMSGPLDKAAFMSGPLDSADRSNFSAPLAYGRRRPGFGRLMRSMSRPMKSALSKTFTRRSQGHPGWMQRFLLHPMTQLVWHSKEAKFRPEAPRSCVEVGPSEPEYSNTRNLQWAHGKAGEDRVHVVLSEEQGWLFVGIYDGFSGPDAPDFLMSNLYKSIDKELEGLLWDYEDKPGKSVPSSGLIENDGVGVSSEFVKEECVGSQLQHDDLEKQGENPSQAHDGCSKKQCNDGVVPIQSNEDATGLETTVKNGSGEAFMEADEIVEEKDGYKDNGWLQSEAGQECSANMGDRNSETASHVNAPESEASCVAATKLASQCRKSKRLYELLQMELLEDYGSNEPWLGSEIWKKRSSWDLQSSASEDLSTRESLPMAQPVSCSSSIKGESSGHVEDAGSPRESEGVLGKDSRDSKHRSVASFSALGQRQMMRRSLIGSKLRKMYRKQKSLRKKLFPWSYDWHRDQPHADERVVNPSVVVRRCKLGPVDHDAVLKAMSRALEATEEAYMEMVEKALDKNPELALMGSCVLVMLMKDQDVYVMNLGDSRVILAQDRLNDRHANQNLAKDDMRHRNRSRESLVRVELDRISEESPMHNPNSRVCNINKNRELSLCRLKMRAVQLSTDHSTSIEEEVLRIKAEHADDPQAVLNDRVKGQLKVTRAFGAGFLKKPKFNEALLEMFRIDYVGTSPYVSCIPSVLHHRLCSNDRFLVLSSDGLYQYFSNEEVVAHVSWFMENVPEGDPAQYLIAELLFRAAKKNGMDFHELLDIPHGDRRKYHDDVSVMVISLEGRIWRSSG